MLGNHRRVHSKPFPCNFCDRKFASMHAAKSHMRFHEDGTDAKQLSWKCDLCTAMYGKRQHLREHQKTDHEAQILIEEDGTEIIVVVAE